MRGQFQPFKISAARDPTKQTSGMWGVILWEVQVAPVFKEIREVPRSVTTMRISGPSAEGRKDKNRELICSHANCNIIRAIMALRVRGRCDVWSSAGVTPKRHPTIPR